MSEGEVMRCPKCKGEMEAGLLRDAPYWRKGTNIVGIGMGSKAIAYKCRHCGYIELWGRREGART
jgi:predicted RNA-binding Zn-ribbon protein involved in translation (DUF1610 family)